MLSNNIRFFGPMTSMIRRLGTTAHNAVGQLTSFQSLPGFYPAQHYGITPPVVERHGLAKIDALKPLYECFNKRIWTVLKETGTTADDLLAADVNIIKQYVQYMLVQTEKKPLTISTFNLLREPERALLLKDKIPDKQPEYLARVN